jgi:hypothetical protein
MVGLTVDPRAALCAAWRHGKSASSLEVTRMKAILKNRRTVLMVVSLSAPLLEIVKIGCEMIKTFCV